MDKPLAIIGDIHGEAEKLSSLLRDVEGRHLVFVGDYVDRGSESRQTLDQLIALQERDVEAVFLRGNHDVRFLAFLDGEVPFHEFAALGGIPTIRAYLTRALGDVRGELLRVFPETHRRFLESCGNFFETPDLIVSHCGINPTSLASREPDDVVLGSHEELFNGTISLPKLVVCGHYTQHSGVPYVRENFICLDTGCGTTGGPLTALLMPERQVLQR